VIVSRINNKNLVYMVVKCFASTNNALFSIGVLPQVAKVVLFLLSWK